MGVFPARLLSFKGQLTLWKLESACLKNPARPTDVYFPLYESDYIFHSRVNHVKAAEKKGQHEIVTPTLGLLAAAHHRETLSFRGTGNYLTRTHLYPLVSPFSLISRRLARRCSFFFLNRNSLWTQVSLRMWSWDGFDENQIFNLMAEDSSHPWSQASAESATLLVSHYTWMEVEAYVSDANNQAFICLVAALESTQRGIILLSFRVLIHC